MPRARTDIDPHWWELLDSEDFEEVELAKDTIARFYQGLVDGLVLTRWTAIGKQIDREELKSYANIGLMQAILRYKPSQGSFRRFASARIQGAIADEMRTVDIAPRGFRKEERTITDAAESLRMQGKEDSIEAIAAESGWAAAKVELVQRRSRSFKHHPIDYAINLPEHNTDVESDAFALAMCARLVRVFDQLSTDVQYLLACCYFRGYTLTEYADMQNIPLATVRDLHRDAVFRVFAEVHAELV